MKKALAWLLVLAMTAALAVGGTLAYLTDTDEDVNVMTVGKVKIDQLEYERENVETENEDATVQEFHDNKPLYPAVIEDDFNWTTGDSYVDWEQIGKDGYTSEIWDPSKINNEVDKMVFVKNKGDFDAYVRTVFAFEAGNYETLDEYLADVHFNLNDINWTWEWEEAPTTIGAGKYFIAVATYDNVLEPGKLTEISLSQIALDPSVTNEDVAGFGDTFQVLVQSQAVQADGFEDADTALTEAFGIIPPEPFENNDSPIRGIDLRRALHYYQGGSTQITAKVSNVVFALNQEYPEIVDNYDATLVDVEQDVPVNAYYVLNGTNYDIYFLANDEIYTPKDSTELFRNMTALQTVDTGNLDVSRTEIMFRMFQSCSKLTQLDTSQWDTSNVTTMARMFQSCTVLPYLDVEGWDVSNVTDMYCLFGGSEKLDNLAVRDWDVSNVTNMAYMFWHCYSVENMDVSQWDVGNVTTFEDIFAGRQNLGNMKIVPAVENWDVSSAVSLRDMFYGCGKIESLDLSKWDVSNVKDMRHTFCDCFNLKSVDFSGWNTPNLENLDGTFNDCRSLVTVDMSNFNTSKVGTMAQLFEACWSLTEVKGMENWDTSSLWEADEMFSGAGSIQVVDLSSFNTSKLVETNRMFSNCSQLTTIYVGDGWDMNAVSVHYDMFAGCGKLVGGNGTVYDGSKTDKTYACVDTPANPGYLTYKAAN